VLIEPAGIAIPGAGDRGGSRGDEQASDLAYSLDDDAALALSLQRHFDLEAMAAGTYDALSPVRVFARLGVTLLQHPHHLLEVVGTFWHLQTATHCC
jgi:hypothetical protein